MTTTYPVWIYVITTSSALTLFNAKIICSSKSEWFQPKYISLRWLSSSDPPEIPMGHDGAGGRCGRSWNVVLPAQAFSRRGFPGTSWHESLRSFLTQETPGVPPPCHVCWWFMSHSWSEGPAEGSASLSITTKSAAWKMKVLNKRRSELFQLLSKLQTLHWNCS